MEIIDHSEIRDNHISEILDHLDSAIETALDAAGMQAATLSARELQKSPERIDTGLLRNSITWALAGKPAAISSYQADRPSEHYSDNSVWAVLQAAQHGSGSYSGTAPADDEHTQSVYIGTNVEYAVYVHEGTKRMVANRFLKNGVLGNREELTEIIKKTLRNA